jgi:hypothetical protein
MKLHENYDLPAPIVIGLTSTGDLTFLIEEYAVGAAAELDRWRAARTWREARELAARAEFVNPPFHVEDLTDDETGDAPFATADQGPVLDGDWPPAAQSLSLELVQRHGDQGQVFDVGVEADTAFNGPLLLIRPDEEAGLRAALEGAGCQVRRDDDLVHRAGEL